MDGSNSVVVYAVSSRKALPTNKRQHRSPELKRQIVEGTLASADALRGGWWPGNRQQRGRTGSTCRRLGTQELPFCRFG